MTRSLAHALAMLSLITCTVLTGCTSSAYPREQDAPTPAEIAHAEAQMRKLPSLEDTHHQLTLIVQQIADAAESIAPELTWERLIRHAQSPLNCRDAYRETDGTSKTTDTWYSEVEISDAAWPRIIDRARQIAAESGMTVFTVLVDEPGDHDIILHSPDHGNEVRIGTRLAATVNGITGCRYRAEDLHPRPHP